ncbi:hypothetical protein N7456_005829 [Penicillium angulare]|uniref:Uncharacterized protein n=1 Tax=Penicillium angulare TaxID=116970 RepID=A0A9W9KJP5_9EURO|nr:hypothetical protein N7456_005829 [Penicillium angulare]
MSVDSTTDSESPKCLSPTPTTQEASETPGAHFTTYGEYLEANRHLFHAFSLPAAPPRNLYLGEDMPHDQDHRLSGHICAIDIASDGSISCMDLEPTGNLVGSVIVNNPCQKSYREQVRCVSAELRTRIVIADRVLNPFFLASFGLEYEFDPEIVLAYLESDGMTSSSKLEYYHMSQIPPVKVPLQSCSKSRKKVLDLGILALLRSYPEPQ